MPCLWLSTKWRQRLSEQTQPLPHHRWCFVSVQDVTEDSNTVGDPGQSDDGGDESTSLSDPSESQSGGKAKAVEGKPEAPVAQPQRRASTPPPPTMPVKLLPRLGSLDGEFTMVTMMWSPTGLLWCLTMMVFLLRCSSGVSEEVPSHLTQKFHTSQRLSWLLVERQDLHTHWVPPPRGTTPTAAP